VASAPRRSRSRAISLPRSCAVVQRVDGFLTRIRGRPVQSHSMPRGATRFSLQYRATRARCQEVRCVRLPCPGPRPFPRPSAESRPPGLAVRYEHIGANRSEQQASFTPKFGTDGYAQMRGTAPGGGASALGTAPMPVPGTRGSSRLGMYDSLRLAEKIKD